MVFKKEVMDLSSQIVLPGKIPQAGSSSGNFLEVGSRRDAGKETVVGFDDEAMKVAEQLMGAKKQLQIISIVGMPGLGKTTLARKVYKDPLISYHFYLRAWVNVSQVPQKRDLLLGILESGFDYIDEDNNTSDEKLSEMLKRRLSGQRYLIVMDDIWDIEAWNDLKWSFPDNKNGSRIIFTSRLADVPWLAQLESYQHHLRFLSDHESWDLFQFKVFQNEKCPPWLVEIGMHITRKCHGLPLAIVVIAGLLANDMTPDRWNQIAKDMTSYAGGEKQYLDTLALSYNHLPPHLKACFLYFGVFPEDYEIPVWKLIFLWVAEGFVQKTDGQNLEEIAAGYLKDLINRSLVIVAKRKSDGDMKACIVHDLLRDLCLTIADEENFLQQVERYKSYSSLLPKNRTMPRRLCIHSLASFETISMPSSQNVQSILCCTGLIFHSPAELNKIALTVFKDLRVLDLSSLPFPTFPIEIVQLVDLRYIALGPTSESIPASISNLQCLEALIVEFPHQRVFVTKNIWSMVKLRHLILSGKYNFEDPCFKEVEHGDCDPYVIENLQTISCLNTSLKSSKEILKRTPNLRKLRFSGTMYQKILSIPNLDKLTCLEKLKLLIKYKQVNREPAILSSSDMFPVTLKKLTLSYTHLKWDEMQRIGMLPNLEVLKLKIRACFGERWETSDGGFRRLKYLKLKQVDIVQWNASSEQFPNLKHLKLVSCRRLKEIPSGLGDIYTLEMIEVRNCFSAVEQCALKMKEDQESKGNDLLKISVSDPKFTSI